MGGPRGEAAPGNPWNPAQAAGPREPHPEGPALEQLERAWEQRVQEAREAGFREGNQRAREEAQALWGQALERLARTLEELSGLRHGLRKQAEEDVVKLSLAVARRILYRELSVDPEALLGLVKAALEKVDAREVHRVRLHPQDAPPLKQALEKMGLPRTLEVVVDPSLERGAVLFETARGGLDVSINTQLEEIGRGFFDILHRHRP